VILRFFGAYIIEVTLTRNIKKITYIEYVIHKTKNNFVNVIICTLLSGFFSA